MVFEKPAILTAIENGSLDLVKKLTGEQDIVEFDSSYRLLAWAVIYGQTDIAQYLLDNGVDINVKYFNGTTPLEAAAGREDDVMIRFLLERNAEIICTPDDKNPASRAMANNRLENFKLILEREKEILSNDDYDKLLAYYRKNVTIYGYATGIMEYLGVNPHADKGKTPTKNDKKKLISYLNSGIKRAVADAAEIYKDEEIYIFSFQADDDMSHIAVYVNTEDNFKASLEDNDKNFKGAEYYYRYCEDEWYVLDIESDYFKKASDYVKKSGLHVEDAIEWDYMILDALRQIRKESYLEELFNHSVILTIYMHEHCDEDEMIKVFRQINDENISNEFAEHIEDFF